MADELRLVLIILGALVIGALFFHGLWTVRKNAGRPRHRYYDETATEEKPAKADGFDELGVGRVRVVKSAVGETKPVAEPVVAQPQPSRPAEQQPELPFEQAEEPQLNFSALEEDEGPAYSSDTSVQEKQADTKAAVTEEPSEVLILYVLLPEHKDMKGAALLSSLLTLGFKYGEMDIFHRHLDSSGSGEVLFSLANMFNPGTFDIDAMEKMSTRGVSLFMTLPGPGEPLQNFNLMHNAAKKLAEEFGGQVLDGQRSVLTVQTVRHYVDKIREFQRQRLIHG